MMVPENAMTAAATCDSCDATQERAAAPAHQMPYPPPTTTAMSKVNGQMDCSLFMC